MVNTGVPIGMLVLEANQNIEKARSEFNKVAPVLSVRDIDTFQYIPNTPPGFSGYDDGCSGFSGKRGLWDQQYGPSNEYIRETLWELEQESINKNQTCPEVKVDLSVEGVMQHQEWVYLKNLENEANEYLKSIYNGNRKKAHSYIPASVAAFIISIPLILLAPLLSIPVCCATIWCIIKSIQYYRLIRHGPVMIDLNNPDGLPYYYYRQTDYTTERRYVEDVYYLK